MKTSNTAVTVEFTGICTHFSKSFHPELPSQHRVVLVNASEATTIRGIPIAPHVVQMILSSPLTDVIEVFNLNGVRFFLEVKDETGITENPGFRGLPNLTELVSGVDTLDGPSHDILLNGTAAEVACYFDTDFGVLDGFLTAHNSASASLSVTPPPGKTVTLYAKALPGGTVPPTLAVPRELAFGTIIGLSNNDADPGTKKVADFLLHYRTSARIPDVPQIPQLDGMLQLLRRPEAIGAVPHDGGHRRLQRDTVGAGCSNSNYP
jgi:hypothetical protein